MINDIETVKFGPLSTLIENRPLSCRRHCLVVHEGHLIRFTILIERK
jgi:hypothetical protein